MVRTVCQAEAVLVLHTPSQAQSPYFCIALCIQAWSSSHCKCQSSSPCCSTQLISGSRSQSERLLHQQPMATPSAVANLPVIDLGKCCQLSQPTRMPTHGKSDRIDGFYNPFTRSQHPGQNSSASIVPDVTYLSLFFILR